MDRVGYLEVDSDRFVSFGLGLEEMELGQIIVGLLMGFVKLDIGLKLIKGRIVILVPNL